MLEPEQAKERLDRQGQPGNSTESTREIRACKCLSDLAIKRSSVTLAVAVGAGGVQEAGKGSEN